MGKAFHRKSTLAHDPHIQMTRIPKAIQEQLDTVARYLDSNYSVVIRQALLHYFRTHPDALAGLKGFEKAQAKK